MRAQTANNYYNVSEFILFTIVTDFDAGPSQTSTKDAFHLNELTDQTRYLEGLTPQFFQINTLRG